MRKLDLVELAKVYSFSPIEKPIAAWAWHISHFEGLFSIPDTLLADVSDMATGWTGWAMDLKNDAALLLFEDREDALLAKVTFGEAYVRY